MADRVIQIKRTLTPDKVPLELAQGELAAALANDPPRMWIGTPDGVKELFSLAEVLQRIADIEARLDDLEK